jgi:hypothetical protein
MTLSGSLPMCQHQSSQALRITNASPSSRPRCNRNNRKHCSTLLLVVLVVAVVLLQCDSRIVSGCCSDNDHPSIRRMPSPNGNNNNKLHRPFIVTTKRSPQVLPNVQRERTRLFQSTIIAQIATLTHWNQNAFVSRQQLTQRILSLRGGGILRIAPPILRSDPTSKTPNPYGTTTPITTTSATDVKEQIDAFLTRDTRNTFIGTSLLTTSHYTMNSLCCFDIFSHIPLLLTDMI